MTDLWSYVLGHTSAATAYEGDDRQRHQGIFAIAAAHPEGPKYTQEAEKDELVRLMSKSRHPVFQEALAPELVILLGSRAGRDKGSKTFEQHLAALGCFVGLFDDVSEGDDIKVKVRGDF